MTAEITVMNRLGVALAADSAVTIGNAQKVYSTADKLFSLSSSAPVGVMVWGSASFLDRPWETVVKEARARLGATRFLYLREYGDFFLRVLGEAGPLFPVDSERRVAERLIRTLFLTTRDEFSRAVDVEVETKGGLSEAEVRQVFAKVVEARLAAVVAKPQIAGIAAAQLKAAQDLAKTLIEPILNQVFDKVPSTDATRLALQACASEMLVRQYGGPYLAGVVIAGFGDDEFTPSVISYELEERYGGVTRLFSTRRVDVVSSDSAINAFAQREAVAAFLEGIDPSLLEAMSSSVKELFTGAVDAIIRHVSISHPEYSKSLDSTVRPGLLQLQASMLAGWTDMRKVSWGPILDMVKVLPKDELAAVAEALVNLTKFRRRVTPVSESVGGPIDVALITKGDGFVWIKRKHYFPADLNPRAISRIRAEASNE